MQGCLCTSQNTKRPRWPHTLPNMKSVQYLTFSCLACRFAEPGHLSVLWLKRISSIRNEIEKCLIKNLTAQRLIINFAFIQRFLIFPGISVMLGSSFCKNMASRQVIIGAHEIIIAWFVIQHSINGRDRRNTDRPWRQSEIFVCIIRRIDFFVDIQNAGNFKIAVSINKRWVSLQQPFTF